MNGNGSLHSNHPPDPAYCELSFWFGASYPCGELISLAAQDERLASRMPSGCGFLTVARNPWPDGTRLAKNISLMAVRS